MQWFRGGVVEAIAETKRTGALFIVVISGGKQEEDAHMTSLWESIDLERDLPWRAVAIRLAAESQDAKNFAQIYPVPAFPITYFIDAHGKPTNVVLHTRIADLTPDQFRLALPKLILPNPEKEAAAGLVRLDGSLSEAAAAAAAPAAVAAALTAAAAAVGAAAPSTSAAAAAPAASSAAELQEKIKRAKALVEKKKAEEEEQKRKEDLARELLRREDAKDAQRAAEERRDKELLAAAAARRKDKAESAAEKERVMARIRADKEEREARFNRQLQQSGSSSTGSSSTTTEETTKRGIAPPPPVASDRCRIQLRFPDGSTALHDFPSSDKLQALRDIAAADARVRGSGFPLAQPAPRVIYGEAHMQQTLLDLSLTPASTLLVLVDSTVTETVAAAAGAAGAAVVQPATSMVTALVGFVTYLIFTPLQYMLSLVGMGGGGAARRGGVQEKKDDPPSASQQQQQHAAGDARAVAAAAAVRRRQPGRANIHTLSTADDDQPEVARGARADNDDDDQEANWNGNSTQFL